MLSWKTGGFVVGALLGVVGLLYLEIPTYLSVPFQIGLLLAGGRLGGMIEMRHRI